MKKKIQGDWVLVNKLIPGPRLFNLSAALREEQTEIYRLPGLRKLRRNDVAVFHHPHPRNRDTIEMHIMKYYVKRCIGLPGDTLSIRNGLYCINNLHSPFGNVEAQQKIAMHDKDSLPETIYGAFPHDSVGGWNIRELGPLPIPRKGNK